MKYLFLLPLLMLFALLLGSCVADSTPLSYETSPTQEITISESTETPIPSAPSTSDVIAGQINTITPTPKPPSTLSPELAPTNLIKQLTVCKLPCWLGLIPGKSTLSDAFEKLYPYSGIADVALLSRQRNGEIGLLIPNDGLLISIYGRYSPLNSGNIIRVVDISAGAYMQVGDGSYESDYGAQFLYEGLSEYRLSVILKRFGVPNEAFLSIENNSANPNPSKFTAMLTYPEHGVFVSYEGPVTIVGDSFRGCFSESFVELWLLSPNDGDYQSILSRFGANWKNIYPRLTEYEKTVQEAMRLSLEEFHTAFLNSENSCFDTSMTLWPSP